MVGLFFDAEELCLPPGFTVYSGLFFDPEVGGDMLL
jgi:hypothetical protein